MFDLRKKVAAMEDMPLEAEMTYTNGSFCVLGEFLQSGVTSVRRPFTRIQHIGFLLLRSKIGLVFATTTTFAATTSAQATATAAATSRY